MRCDIRQLAAKGPANDYSVTTLATDGATRSPSPSRRVRFSEPQTTRSMQPHYASLRPLRLAAAVSGNCAFTPPSRSDRREIVNGRFNGQNNRQ